MITPSGVNSYSMVRTVAQIPGKAAPVSSLSRKKVLAARHMVVQAGALLCLVTALLHRAHQSIMSEVQETTMLDVSEIYCVHVQPNALKV